MRMNKRIIAIFIIFAFVFTNINVKVISANEKLSINGMPTLSYSIIGDTNVGNTYEIAINANNLFDLYGFSFEFKYDTSCMEVLSISKGNVFDGLNSNVIINSIQDNIVNYAVTLIGNINGVNKNSSELMRIKVKALKETDISLKTTSDNIELDNYGKNVKIKLSNSKSIKIPYSVVDYNYKQNNVSSGNVNVTDIKLKLSSQLIIVDDNIRLIADISPSNATNKGIKWTSNNKNIVTVNSDGVIKGINPGTATITAEALDGGKKDECTVTVYNAYDIDWSNSWAKREIRYAMDNGWIKQSTTFRPNDAITRAEFIKIVNKAFGYKAKAISQEFIDVNEAQWWYNEVLIALKAGYISSKNEKFRPTDPITREEVASIITTIKGNKDKNLDKLSKFKDVNLVSEWAKSSVEGAIEAGYMGMNSEYFNPKKNITRAEAVTTLYRVSK